MYISCLCRFPGFFLFNVFVVVVVVFVVIQFSQFVTMLPGEFL